MFKHLTVTIALVMGVLAPVGVVCASSTPLQLAVDSTPTNASADINNLLDAAGTPSGLSSRSPQLTVAYLIYNTLTLLGVAFLVLVAYAGFLWFSAGGEEEKITKAKGLLTNGIIGMVIILSAYGITRLVFNYLIKAAVTNPVTSGDQYPSYKP